MPAGDLITLADFKMWAGITASADDRRLTAAIARVSAATKNFLKRDILTATYTHSFDGTGTPTLVLRQFPITAVASVAVDGITIPYAPPPARTGYRFDDRALYLVNAQVFARDLQNVAVTYTAGYASTPADIAQGVMEWLNIIYRELDHVGYTSKSLAGETVAFDVKDMPARVKSYFAPWRRVAPI